MSGVLWPISLVHLDQSLAHICPVPLASLPGQRRRRQLAALSFDGRSDEVTSPCFQRRHAFSYDCQAYKSTDACCENQTNKFGQVLTTEAWRSGHALSWPFERANPQATGGKAARDPTSRAAACPRSPAPPAWTFLCWVPTEVTTLAWILKHPISRYDWQRPSFASVLVRSCMPRGSSSETVQRTAREDGKALAKPVEEVQQLRRMPGQQRELLSTRCNKPCEVQFQQFSPRQAASFVTLLRGIWQQVGCHVN